ncbi:LysE family translocator [Pseudobowmanella zhangzhouensis]|uniref:LysE family translocator n=1 Tax=Pseudobowmanella zhangzhouensis TaxID=1537679 RepID=UPI003606FAB1
MPSTESLLAFIVTAILLSLSPGPSNMYIMARSMSQGARGGITAAAGLAVGSFIYVLASAFGLAAVFIYSPLAFTTLKVLGGLYLLYLAWQYFHASGQTQINTHLRKRPGWRIFRQSIVVELSNPKTALFFIAFLPQFADGPTESFTQQLLLLGSLYAMIAFCCDLLVASIAGVLAKWLSGHPGAVRWQDRISGGLLGLLVSIILYEEWQSAE